MSKLTFVLLMTMVLVIECRSPVYDGCIVCGTNGRTFQSDCNIAGNQVRFKVDFKRVD